MPPKKSPIIKVSQTKESIKKTHVSTWLITINTNNPNGDEEVLQHARDSVFNEQYLSEHLSDMIKITSKRDKDMELEDVIEGVDLDVGPVEYMKTRAHAPHTHVSLSITHTTLLQLNYEKIRAMITKAADGAKWHIDFSMHKDYRYTTRNYANKTAITS